MDHCSDGDGDGGGNGPLLRRGRESIKNRGNEKEFQMSARTSNWKKQLFSFSGKKRHILNWIQTVRVGSRGLQVTSVINNPSSSFPLLLLLLLRRRQKYFDSAPVKKRNDVSQSITIHRKRGFRFRLSRRRPPPPPPPKQPPHAQRRPRPIWESETRVFRKKKRERKGVLHICQIAFRVSLARDEWYFSGNTHRATAIFSSFAL